MALPLLRAVHRAHGPVHLVHFDSHFDFWDQPGGQRYTRGTWLRRAYEGQLVGGVLQIGIRGPQYTRDNFRYAVDHGFRVVTLRELEQDLAGTPSGRRSPPYRLRATLVQFLGATLENRAVVDQAHALHQGHPGGNGPHRLQSNGRSWERRRWPARSGTGSAFAKRGGPVGRRTAPESCGRLVPRWATLTAPRLPGLCWHSG